MVRRFEAGEVMRVNVYPVRAAARSRSVKLLVTRACQAALNRRNSKKRFSDIAHLNFNRHTGGLRVSLDYDFFLEDLGRNPSPKEYKAYLAAYFRRLRTIYAKFGGELKYLAMTHVGRKAGRVHHHCIISLPPEGLGWEVLRDVWGMGYSNYVPLYFRNGSISGLTSYFFDNSVDSRWSCSRNCRRPSAEPYADGTPPSVTFDASFISMSQAYYLDSHRDDISFIESLFPGYAVGYVRPKPDLSAFGGTVFPFDGPFIEIELYRISGKVEIGN